MRDTRGMRCLTLLLLVATVATAQSEPERKLIVGLKPAPPFVLRGSDGTWEGISVELWQRVAKALGREYEVREMKLDQLLAATAAGEVGVGVGALTVTAAREERMDFSHTFFNAGLAIAVPGREESASPFRALLTWRFLRAVGTLVLILFAVGLVVWLLERRRNPDQFGRGRFLPGVGEGFWWSAVTMTTVGYGDRAPATLLGRGVAVVWMFASVIIIATFTGAIASALTVERLEGALAGPEDLPGHRIAALASSTAEQYLRREGIATVTAENTDELVRLVLDGEAEAAVHDAPLLLYLARTTAEGRLTVLPRQFERQDYAFALPPGSPLRESINRALLETTASREWTDILRRHLGR
jgi:ABC-type amino acid transport substrate-binding protein